MMPRIPLPDPAAVYAEAPPLPAELAWFMDQAIDYVRHGSRPATRANLVRKAALADRNLLLAEETVAAYGRQRTGPAGEARQALAEGKEQAARAAAELEAYDQAHGTRAGDHASRDFGPGLAGQRAYVRQEYAAQHRSQA